MTQLAEPRLRGQRTQAGNIASSRNALKHGMTAKKHLVLEHEDPQAFDAFCTGIMDWLEPVGPVETLFARRAACLWRLDRAPTVEAAVMDYAFADTLTVGVEEFTPTQRFQRALIASINNDHLVPVHRYEITLQRLLDRTLDRLKDLQLRRLFKSRAPEQPQ